MDRVYAAHVIWPIIVGAVVYHYRLEFLRLARTKIVSDASHPYLVIGVMSARENFKERQLIRDTWASVLRNNETIANRVYLKFLVGDTPCEIPKEDRQDQYSCQHWEFTEDAPAFTDKEHFAARGFPKKMTINTRRQSSLAFKAHFNIVIDKLGVHTSLISEQAASIQLIHAESGTVIYKTELTTEDRIITKDGYAYKAIEAFFIPKGFEGRMSLSLPTEDSLSVLETEELGHIVVNTGGQILEYSSYDEEELIFHDSSGFLQPVVSFGFKIHDLLAFKSFNSARAKRKQEWDLQQEDEEAKIAGEIEAHHDLILLEDVTDFYRNLPSKLLAFLQWQQRTNNADYIMKTDDDSFLNVRAVVDSIDTWDQPEPYIWWARFRKRWGVERVGKWAEPDYTSPAYPSFACGGGYILGAAVVQWLASNRENLHLYQGEDVSLGIWLSAIKHKKKESVEWQCASECLPNAFTITQLSSEELKHHWQNYVACGNPCQCS